MERKIGEIFELGGEWYQCIIGHCNQCSFDEAGTCKFIGNPYCAYRNDKKLACFKKLEKVGEPYEFDGHLFQSYHTFAVPIFTENYATVRELGNNSKISIEIKQIKEDMEETKLNIKPFSLEAAKAGKPVCTRDGRKARIICFDAKDTQPIIGLYEKNIDGIVREYLCSYHTDGRMYDDQDTGYDLMMSPEKKEGWINVYKMKESTFGYITAYFDTEEKAKEDKEQLTGYVATVKINWEE